MRLLRARFLFEALQARRIRGEFARQDLDGHRPPEPRIARAEDLPIAPAPIREMIS